MAIKGRQQQAWSSGDYGKAGIDYVPALLEKGRRRAQADGLPADFWEGDAEDIPFADASLDVVLSILDRSGDGTAVRPVDYLEVVATRR